MGFGCRADVVVVVVIEDRVNEVSRSRTQTQGRARPDSRYGVSPEAARWLARRAKDEKPRTKTARKGQALNWGFGEDGERRGAVSGVAVVVLEESAVDEGGEFVVAEGEVVEEEDEEE